MNIIYTQKYLSPCGELVLGSLDGRLCLCNWSENVKVTARVSRLLDGECVDEPSVTTAEAARQLDEYFAHARKKFIIPLLFAGTDFQKCVWHELQNIGYGETISYAVQARRLGRPKAVRAVAAANTANALSIIVPCHRVIGTSGKLTGYAGGIKAKKFLLEAEASDLPF